MGSVVGAFFMPHDPLMFAAPDAVMPDVRARVFAAFKEIRCSIAALRPTAAVVIGADHFINFGPGCLPQYLIGIGDVSGPIERLPGLARGPMTSNPGLARHIADSGMEEGFDWAVAKVINVDHAVGVPVRLCLEESVAVVPVYLASGVSPYLRMTRAHALGGSILRAIKSWPHDDRVIVIGSGGVSHWVGMPEQGRVNAAFDTKVLNWVAAGDAASLMALRDEEIMAEGGNGAMEIRQFLCAMGAAPGATGRVIAYEPSPEWITGLGFAELHVT